MQNHYADLLLCWDQLRARGYSRVGLVVRADLAERWSHQWEAAHSFTQSKAAAKLDYVPTLEIRGNNALAQIRSWLREHKPQVVINRSEDFLAAAEAEGLRVPQNVGYIGLNVVDDAPNVSGILQHRDVMGATAVDVLNRLLQRNHRGFHRVSLGTQVDGSWHEGQTLPPLPKPVIPGRRSMFAA